MELLRDVLIFIYIFSRTGRWQECGEMSAKYIIPIFLDRIYSLVTFHTAGWTSFICLLWGSVSLTNADDSQTKEKEKGNLTRYDAHVFNNTRKKRGISLFNNNRWYVDAYPHKNLYFLVFIYSIIESIQYINTSVSQLLISVVGCLFFIFFLQEKSSLHTYPSVSLYYSCSI